MNEKMEEWNYYIWPVQELSMMKKYSHPQFIDWKIETEAKHLAQSHTVSESLRTWDLDPLLSVFSATPHGLLNLYPHVF